MRRLAAVAALALGLFAIPATAHADPWPSPPGANNWHCKPSKAHPNPVVLAHGLTANQLANWAVLAPQIAAKGYCVYSLTYGTLPNTPPPIDLIGGLVPMEQSSRQFGAFVDKVLAATGAKKVDIVGHSEGSMMPNYYVKFLGGAAKVDHYVGITPLWQGSQVYGLALLNQLAKGWGWDPALAGTVDKLCGSCREFLAGSDFLKKMNAGGAAVPGVKYTMLMTRHDEAVQPWQSGYLDGADNIVVQDQCAADLSEHVAMAVDPIVAKDVFNALDPEHAKPVHC